MTVLSPIITKDSGGKLTLHWNADPLAKAYLISTPSGNSIAGATKTTANLGVHDTITVSISALYSQAAETAVYPPVTPPPPPPPPPVGTRPFVATSALNQPIPAAAPIHADSPQMIQGNPNWVLPAASPYKEWVGPRQRIVYAHVPDLAALPTVAVHVNYPKADAAVKQMPMPPLVQQALSTAAGLNHDRVGYLCDAKGDTWEFSHLTPPGTVSMDPASSNNQWNANRCDSHPAEEATGKGYGWPYGCSASRILNGAGLLRPEDFPAGFDPTVPIPHALRINGCLEPTRTGSPHPNFVPPAGSADYNGPFADARAIPIGARLQLDPAFDVSGAKPWLRKLGLTLQTYGCILVDNSGAQGAGGLESCNTVGNGAYRYPWETDGSGWAYGNGLPYAWMPHFRVVDWDRWTGA